MLVSGQRTRKETRSQRKQRTSVTKQLWNFWQKKRTALHSRPRYKSFVQRWVWKAPTTRRTSPVCTNRAAYRSQPQVAQFRPLCWPTSTAWFRSLHLRTPDISSCLSVWIDQIFPAYVYSFFCFFFIFGLVWFVFVLHLLILYLFLYTLSDFLLLVKHIWQHSY